MDVTELQTAARKRSGSAELSSYPNIQKTNDNVFYRKLIALLERKH